MLLRDYLARPELKKLLEKMVIVVIPVYNVDGCLNRNSFTRANQEGPTADRHLLCHRRLPHALAEAAAWIASRTC